MAQLIFTDEGLVELVTNLTSKVKNTLIVADSYSYPIVAELGDTVLIISNEIEPADEIRHDREYNAVIAIGGCTALDVGKYIAAGVCEHYAIPTLSTGCISKEYGLLRRGGKTVKMVSESPNQTIVSYPFVMGGNQADVIKWTSSGFGDSLSHFGRILEFVTDPKNSYTEKVINDGYWPTVVSLGPEFITTAKWVLEDFVGYDKKDTFEMLANLSHKISFEQRFSPGGEHKLYEALMQQNGYSAYQPTHGHLVAIGTLLTAKAIENSNPGKSGNSHLFDVLQRTFRKLSIPCSFLEIGVANPREYLKQGLDGIADTDTLLGRYVKENGAVDLLNEVLS
ncbi:MAG: hypothetical protein V1859_00005 [archaeon]